jgi:iron complex outermembrane receptor protein/hemoglobin/transferrin/lactoferrin receptor protein
VWRLGSLLSFAVVVENLLDLPYRYHGSSVNGPGRGVLATAELSPSSAR